MISPKTTKLIAIVGPTASGKTALALELGQKLNGEIISADSRASYKGMDIGTAKPTAVQQSLVRHHLIDIANPDKTITLSQYKALAVKAIKDVATRGKLPLLVGGTPLYTYAILENWQIPEVPPQTALRAKLEQEPLEDLRQRLTLLDPKAIEFIDPDNKRRVIRALEVIAATGAKFSDQRKAGPRIFETLKFGLRANESQLRQAISQRTDEMLEAGLIEEVESLLKNGYSKSLPALSGIHYQEVIAYLEHTLSREAMVELINTHDWQLTRRQMTWYKKDPAIHWISSADEAISLITAFTSPVTGTP